MSSFAKALQNDRETIAIWVETIAKGAGHWRIAFETYQEARRRGYEAVVLSSSSEQATGLFSFDDKDIIRLTMPEVNEANYYQHGETWLPRPNEDAQRNYANQMISALSGRDVVAFITEQQPFGNLNRGWFMKPLGQLYEHFEASVEGKPVCGAIVRPNTLGRKDEHFQGGVTGPAMVTQRVIDHLDFVAVRGIKEITDLAETHYAAKDPHIQSVLHYVGYITPNNVSSNDRSGTIISAGSNWFPDNTEFYTQTIRAFHLLKDDLKKGGLRVLLPRDTPLDMEARIRRIAAEFPTEDISVTHNVGAKEFEGFLAGKKLLILRPGNSTSEALVAGADVLMAPQLTGKDPEQMIRALNIHSNGLAKCMVLDNPPMSREIREALIRKAGDEGAQQLTVHTPEDIARIIEADPPTPRVDVKSNGAGNLLNLVEKYRGKQEFRDFF